MVSVIVPYYNAAPWLVRCCQSLTDNAGEFEFVMVDDHSEDGGSNIVKAYAETDKRFVMLMNEHGKGVSGARNTGIDHARGEWVTFLDADDKLAPEAFGQFSEAIKGGRFNIYQFDHFRYYTKTDRLVCKYRNPAGVYDVINPPLLLCLVWNKLIKVDFIGATRFDESLQYCEDEIFIWNLLAKDRRVCCIGGETVIHYFDNPTSLAKSKTAESLYKQTAALIGFLKEQTDPVIKCAVCRSISTHWASDTYLDTIGERGKIGENYGKE